MLLLWLSSPRNARKGIGSPPRSICQGCCCALGRPWSLPSRPAVLSLALPPLVPAYLSALWEGGACLENIRSAGPSEAFEAFRKETSANGSVAHAGECKPCIHVMHATCILGVFMPHELCDDEVEAVANAEAHGREFVKAYRSRMRACPHSASEAELVGTLSGSSSS